MEAIDSRIEQFNQILDYWYAQEFFSPCWPKDKHIKTFCEDSYKVSRSPNTYFSTPLWPDSTCCTVRKPSKAPEAKDATSVTTVTFDLYFGAIIISDIEKWMIEELGLEDDYKPEKDMKKTCIFAIKLDAEGKYIPGSFGISSLVWAICSLVSAGSPCFKLDHIKMFEYQKSFDERILRDYTDLAEIPATIQILQILFDRVCSDIQLSNKLRTFSFRVNRKESKSKSGGEQPADKTTELLHSFLLNDIQLVQKAPTESIKQYVLANLEKPPTIARTDFAKAPEEMSKWLAADAYPLGMWPSPYSPTLMQQVAINIAISGEQKIFSVNGPPGTGKTTLLKEIVAHNIIKRAELMVEFPTPDKAFSSESFCSSPGQNLETYYIPCSKLCDYGMIVTSSNNTAVENVTTELPERITKDKTGLFKAVSDTQHRNIYFGDIATNLLGKEAWGLVSAPLGNHSNLEAFRSAVWYGKAGQSLRSHRKIENALNWNAEVMKFQEKMREVKNDRAYIRKAQDSLIKLRNAEKSYTDAITEYEKLHLEYTQKRGELADLDAHISEAQTAANQARAGLIKLIYRLVWILLILVRKWAEISTRKQLTPIKNKLAKALENMQGAERKMHESQQAVIEYQKIFGQSWADEEFFNRLKQGHEEQKQSQEACPWTYPSYNNHREELFHQALMVHKAFYLNSKCAQHNLTLLIERVWKGEITGEDRKKSYIHLLNTLLLVVPVISTTFASVQTLLKDVDAEKIGYLIVDEAGQATPQSVLGAMWRSKHSIIVGDPLQIEPVTDIPKKLRECLAKQYSCVTNYTHPEISVQELADAVNPYGSYRTNGNKQLWLGCPLITHIRCLDPMFEISNTLAYNGTMFSMTPDMDTTKPHLLQKSCWLQITGKEKGRTGEKPDHSVEAQTQIVKEMIDRAFQIYDGFPNIYVIAPFKTVIEPIKTTLSTHIHSRYPELAKCLHESSQLSSHKKTNDPINNWVSDHCGTVHTFQGKQASEVIFVLGCDTNSMMAAQWVGKSVNMVNVALTRAKHRIVVIGDYHLWKKIPYVRSIIEHQSIEIIASADTIMNTKPIKDAGDSAK